MCGGSRARFRNNVKNCTAGALITFRSFAEQQSSEGGRLRGGCQIYF